MLLSAAFIVQVWMLKQMPYSRSTMTAVTADEALSPADPLQLAGNSWHPERYAAAQSLAPLRTVVQEHCFGLRAYETGTCLEGLFARRFRLGLPSREFFDADFDPAAVFAAHLAGEPGHCVSRAGMLAAALLAVGIPARVVQIVRRDGFGHNVAEIWEAGSGWRVIDPSYAGNLRGPNGGIAAAAAVRSGNGAHWESDRTRPNVAGVEQAEATQHYRTEELHRSTIIYPDPWLYTRVGNPQAPRPFRGHFVRVGPRTLHLGLGQLVLQIAILLSSAGLLAIGSSVAMQALVAIRRQVPSAAPEAPESTH